VDNSDVAQEINKGQTKRLYLAGFDVRPALPALADLGEAASQAELLG
jgi:hypothetical protein